MFLALDSDLFLMRAATSAETEIDWGDDIWSLWMDLKEAQQAFTQQVYNVVADTGVTDIICCLTDPEGNFRRDVDPSYKSNRKKSRKPVGYKALTDWVRSEYKTVMKPKLEADDCMGILATMPINKGKAIIVSDDKDMRTIPGQLYLPTKKEMIDISEADADEFFLTQALSGDPVDGVKGLPGFGPVKAKAALGPRPHWGAVEKAYVQAGYTPEDAIRQARLVRILRWDDWDDKKGEPILWNPNTSATKTT